MNIVTGKHLSRRTLLRGAGVAIGLPLLDAMRPALAGSAAGDVPQARRLVVVYVPNGIIMNDWLPKETGADFTFPRILKPLEPFRSDITVVSGLVNHGPDKARGGDHAKASGSFLSGMPPKFTAGADVHAGVTFDQIAANQWAGQTRIPSLQLGCEDARMVGNCDTGSSCAYTNTLSWKDPDTPLPVEVNPRSVFEQLFGTVDPSISPEIRARRALYRRSILDESREDARKLVSSLGAADKRKVDQYLSGVRDLERAIAETENDKRVPPIEKPSGIPFEYRQYVKLMFDLQVAAFQQDLTRVSTMMLGREGSVRTYPEIGVPDPHHPLTHHRGHPDFIEKVTRINCYHVELLAYFLGRLRSTREGDSTLLDRSTILYGGALSDGNSHSRVNLPLLVAGGCGQWRGGRHVAVKPQPVTNLFVEMMNSVGVETAAFADSSGRLELEA
jgi:hypothetical protein